MNSGASVPPTSTQNNSSAAQPTTSSLPNISGLTSDPMSRSRASIATKVRADGKQYRPITPLEALYYHERLDLITHPLIKGTKPNELLSLYLLLLLL